MPKILITNTLDKNEAIKRVREDNPFEQIKFYTINELQKIILILILQKH